MINQEQINNMDSNALTEIVNMIIISNKVFIPFYWGEEDIEYNITEEKGEQDEEVVTQQLEMVMNDLKEVDYDCSELSEVIMDLIKKL